MRIAYQAVLDPAEEGGFCVAFPDLPGAITEGDSWEEAMFNAEEVLNLILSVQMEKGLAIPEPKEYEKGIWVYPNPQVQAALLIRFARDEKTLADLARCLETSWPAAKRLENPKNSPTIKQLSKVANVLGKRLVLEFEEKPRHDRPGQGA